MTHPILMRAAVVIALTALIFSTPTATPTDTAKKGWPILEITEAMTVTER